MELGWDSDDGVVEEQSADSATSNEATPDSPPAFPNPALYK